MVQLFSGASHLVLINDEDVSADVTSIHTDQAVETDSDPAKITIRLANRGSKYNDKYPPMRTTFVIKVMNKRYGEEEEIYHVAQGHMTDLSCDKEPGIAIFGGECEIGHLSDAYPQNETFDHKTVLEVLKLTLAEHDPPITEDRIHFHARDKMMMDFDIAQGDTFQDILDELRVQVGAIFWMDEETNELNFFDPYFYDNRDAPRSLDFRVSNPDQCLSVEGYRNAVSTNGYVSDYPENEDGSESTDVDPLIGLADESAALGEYRMFAQKLDLIETTQRGDEIDDLAYQNLNFYRQFKDALTEPIVHGMCPNLFELVSYTNPNWNPAGDDHVVEGVVMRKVLDYNESQFETKLTVSRGALAIEALGDIIDTQEEIDDIEEE